MIENTVLDIYDIGANAFVKQATQGDIMKPRVNHCAVRGERFPLTNLGFQGIH